MRNLEKLLESVKADENIKICELFIGETKSGKDFWCYINILPSKYLGFKILQENDKSINLREFGEIICSGWGKTPPEEVICKIKASNSEDKNGNNVEFMLYKMLKVIKEGNL